MAEAWRRNYAPVTPPRARCCRHFISSPLRVPHHHGTTDIVVPAASPHPIDLSHPSCNTHNLCRPSEPYSRYRLVPRLLRSASLRSTQLSGMATISESSRIPQPSSRVPSITAPSWREATDSTRTYVNFRDGGMCWLCGTHAPDIMEVAHQISACQTNLVRFVLS